MSEINWLMRVIPEAALDELNLLSGEQALKFAGYAEDLVRLQESPLLACVPATIEDGHKVADLAKVAGVALADLEMSRKERVGPLNAEVKRVNALYGLLIGPLTAAEAKAKQLFLAHIQAERARVRREQEEQQRLQREAAEREEAATRKAAEAATEQERAQARAEAEAASMAIAQASVSEPAPPPKAYRSEVGTLSIRETYVLSAFDPDKIPAEYWRREKVLEAVRKELAAAVRAGAREIPGCSIEIVEGTARRS